MVWRLLSIVLGAIALAAAGSATYVYFELSRRERPPGLVVEPTKRILEGLVVGREYEVGFTVRNPTDEPRRVVGNEFS